MVRDLGNLWLIGAGNMGSALLRGWLAAGFSGAGSIVIDPRKAELPDGRSASPAVPSHAPVPDVLILAVKPQAFDLVAAELIPYINDQTSILSLLPGITVSQIRRTLRLQKVARLMPNLPVSILKGATAAFEPDGDDRLRNLVLDLMSPLGIVEWLATEDMMDAATAIAGCGPAFVFRFIDALSSAAIELGLPEHQARRLAMAVASGAGASACEGAVRTGELADAVASEGGATRAGLDILDDKNALQTLISQTLSAAARRSRELAEASVSP